jgi:hypothetical protein
VLYQTRIQRERFQDRPEEYELARGKFIVDQAVMDVRLPPPLPLTPLTTVISSLRWGLAHHAAGDRSEWYG